MSRRRRGRRAREEQGHARGAEQPHRRLVEPGDDRGGARHHPLDTGDAVAGRVAHEELVGALPEHRHRLARGIERGTHEQREDARLLGLMGQGRRRQRPGARIEGAEHVLHGPRA